MSQPLEDIHIVLRTCPMCGHEVDEIDRQCATCGEALEVRPAITLHPLRGAFFGGMAAAGIVLGINYKRMGRGTAAAGVIVFSIIATLVVFVGLDLLIPQMPALLISLLSLWVVYLVANALQGRQIREHIKQGGRIASSWQGVGIGFATGVCVAIVAVAVFLTFPSTLGLESAHGKVVNFGNDEVYYDGEATEADARKLAAFLTDEDFFEGDGISVRVEARAGRYRVSFVLEDGAWEQKLVIAYYRRLARKMSESLFPPHVTIQLCDEHFRAQRTIDGD